MFVMNLIIVVLVCFCSGWSKEPNYEAGTNFAAKKELPSWFKETKGSAHKLKVSPCSVGNFDASAIIPIGSPNMLANDQMANQKLKNSLIHLENDSLRRFARQNPAFIQDFITHFQRTNEQLIQNWTPTLDNLQQAPLLQQMPLLGQALGQSILGSADALLEAFGGSKGIKDSNTTLKPSLQSKPERGKTLERNSSTSESFRTLDALLGTLLFEAVQNFAKNPTQLSDIISRVDQTTIDAAASDILEVKARPNNIVKRTVPKDVSDVKLQGIKKFIPLLWLHLTKSSAKETKSAAYDKEMQKKIDALEVQLVRELEKLQSIVELANEIKMITNSDRDENIIALNKIPIYEITIEDIDKAVRDPYVINMLSIMQKYRNTSPQKRETPINLKDIINVMDYVKFFQNNVIVDESIGGGNTTTLNKGHIMQAGESQFIQDQLPVLECQLLDAQSLKTTTEASIKNHYVQNSANTEMDTRYYYNSARPPRYPYLTSNSLTETPQAVNDHPLHAFQKLKQCLEPKDPITDSMQGHMKSLWSSDAHNGHAKNRHVQYHTNEMKPTTQIKENKMNDSMNDISKLTPQPSSPHIINDSVALTKTEANNEAILNNSMPIDVRMATPQKLEHVLMHKGNLYGILPYDSVQNSLDSLQHYHSHLYLNRYRQQHPKDLLGQKERKYVQSTINYSNNKVEENELSPTRSPSIRISNSTPINMDIKLHLDTDSLAPINSDTINVYPSAFKEGKSSKNVPTNYLINPLPSHWPSNLILNPEHTLTPAVSKQYYLPDNGKPLTNSLSSEKSNKQLPPTFLTDLHESGVCDSNYLNNAKKPYMKMAVGDKQILQMLRAHHTLPPCQFNNR